MLRCKIRFNNKKTNAHISQVLTGYKLLEKEGVIGLDVVDRHTEFRKLGMYDHTSIVEVRFDNSTLVYDMADGYQSITDKKRFDSHLDKVTYYFKRSFLPEFHIGMRNQCKMKPYGLNYHCTCRGNPYDVRDRGSFSLGELRKTISYYFGERKWRRLIDYRQFVSNEHYDQYRVLFLTRLWDSSAIHKNVLRNSFPEMSDLELSQLVDKWRCDLENTTASRIQLLYGLREHFGDVFNGGVENSEVARRKCPDLIVDARKTSKEQFMKLVRSNYVCIASTGLHDSIGWKTAEYVTNGRAFLTEPLRYTVTGDFSAPRNYLEFTTPEECIQLCDKLLNNVNMIHEIENNNATYYARYLAPDQIIRRSLEVAGIL